MRLLAAESTHTSTHHTTASTMSCEQEFGGGAAGAAGVTLTLRLLMHGKVSQGQRFMFLLLLTDFGLKLLRILGFV